MDNTSKTLYTHASEAARDEASEPMKIALMSQNGQLSEVWLPNRLSGKYCFTQIPGGKPTSFVSIQAVNERWCAVCSGNAFFQEDSVTASGSVEPVNCGSIMPLVDRRIYHIKVEGDLFTLYSEKSNAESNIFHAYTIQKNHDITIGRMESNDICIDSRFRFVSRQHAILSWRQDGLHIIDWKSRNGVFLNNTAVKDQLVHIGDTIFIMGLRIVIGAGFIAMNDGNLRIRACSDKLHRISPEYCKEMAYFTMPSDKLQQHTLFNRTPRRRSALTPRKITLEAPPMSLSGTGLPLLLRMGSSAVMGGSAALAGNYTMLLTSVLFPFLSQKYTDKEKKEYEERRNTKYSAYLADKQKEIEAELAHEEKVLRDNYPDLSVFLGYAINDRKHLWERRPVDDDFLALRLGSGNQQMLGELEYPEQKFNLDQDELENRMYSIAEAEYMLKGIPVLLNTVKYNVIGLVGARKIKTCFLRQLIAQIAVLHSYDEVKIVLLLEPAELKEMEFVSFLPHVWNDERNVRFIASTLGEAGTIGEYIKNSIEESLTTPVSLEDTVKSRPYFFIISTSKRLFDSMEVLKDILRHDTNVGVSLLAAMEDLPKECSIQVEIGKYNSGKLVYLRDVEKNDVVFSIDKCPEDLLNHSMKIVANTNLRLLSSTFSLPKSYTFLEMFGVGRVEHLNVAKRWQDNNPVFSLSVPIGVTTDGTPFYLDLHQKFQGPHGLVAGMTGSGKSEFLVTYILSLAVNFHPDEVAFVLIDYKGGGLAGAFDDKARGIHLPHLVATITNLDGSTIQRSLVSIESELKRRQHVLNEARSLSDEGTIDIYSYQRMYRNKIVTDPMPHLFIICDEFAELKQQQPEFMDQLISIARIGRSLGVHLILATQKPAGVVNEQIRGNTKFRVCLKVQDKTDSMDMLQRPEAASLRETGRFYLQVGYNEFFALGQSAWSGAIYQPQDEVIVQKDESVLFIDGAGQSILSIKPEQPPKKDGSSQLIEIVRMLTALAAEQKIKPRSLWKPALPKELDFSQLVESPNTDEQSGHVTARIGRVDDPQRQKQFTLQIDFNKSGNLLIIGESGSGKTTLIHTIVRQLVQRYSPEEFQFYAMDYSSRMLKHYKNLPHCGGVLLEEDNASLSHFFKLIQKITSERKKLFSSLGMDDFTSISYTHRLPLILVIIDNLSGLSTTKEGEQIAYNLSSYLKDGPKFGVKYIITESHINSVPSKVKLETPERLSLHMKDKYEYGDVLNAKVEYCPADTPGRGLCVTDERCLEFQAAMFITRERSAEDVSGLQAEVAGIVRKYADCQAAQRLPVMDVKADYLDFCSQFKLKRIPVGFSAATNRPIALPLKQFSTLGVYFGRPASKLPILTNLITGLLREKPRLIIVKRKTGSVFDLANELGKAVNDSSDTSVIELSPKSVSDLWRHSLSDEITHRVEIHKAYCEENGLDDSDNRNDKASYRRLMEETAPLIILFESFADFCDTADFLSRLVFGKYISAASHCNLYFICCFEPDDSMDLQGDPLMIGFNGDGPTILFGGKYNHQTICHIPDSVDGEAELPFNLCLMRYQGVLHPLLMPCGESEEETIDEDDKNIFE